MVGQRHCNCVIEADGNMYQCDFYVLDKRKLRNITEASIDDMLKCKTTNSFLLQSLNNLEFAKTVAGSCFAGRMYEGMRTTYGKSGADQSLLHSLQELF